MFFDKYFITQIILTFTVIIFCMRMIIIEPSPTNLSIFLPIITTISSIWLPQPQHKSLNDIENPP